MKTWFQRNVLSLLYGRIPWTDHPSDSRLSRWIRRYIKNFDVTKYPELLGRPLYGLVITGEMGNVMERMSSHYFERIVAALQRFCVADQSGGAVALAVDLSEFASVKLMHKNVVVPPNLFEDP